MLSELQGPSDRVKAILLELTSCGDLTPGHFFLGGSAGLALRDLRHVGDIDVGVTTRHWFQLLVTSGWNLWTPDPMDERRRCDPAYLVRIVNGVEVHAFNSWRRRGKEETEYNDFNLAFSEGTELVNGWPCIKLKILLRMKTDALSHPMLRAKDLSDVALIAHAIELEEVE